MGNIAETVRDADLVVAGWGNNAWDPRRVDQVRSLLPGPLHALGVTKGGNPGHPLYLKGDSQLVKWADAVSASAGEDKGGAESAPARGKCGHPVGHNNQPCILTPLHDGNHRSR